MTTSTGRRPKLSSLLFPFLVSAKNCKIFQAFSCLPILSFFEQRD
jgi:hypothetical protein